MLESHISKIKIKIKINQVFIKYLYEVNYWQYIQAEKWFGNNAIVTSKRRRNVVLA